MVKNKNTTGNQKNRQKAQVFCGTTSLTFIILLLQCLISNLPRKHYRNVLCDPSSGSMTFYDISVFSWHFFTHNLYPYILHPYNSLQVLWWQPQCPHINSYRATTLRPCSHGGFQYRNMHAICTEIRMNSEWKALNGANPRRDTWWNPLQKKMKSAPEIHKEFCCVYAVDFSVSQNLSCEQLLTTTVP